MLFTFLVGIDAVVGVELLVSLLLMDGLAKYRIPVHDVDGFLLASTPCDRSHAGGDVYPLPRQLERYALRILNAILL